MAGTRLDKLGTIFSRVTSLMKCGAVLPEDKPLWYDIYHAFPPIYEPSYARRVPKTEIKEILYPEDRIRAKFHKDHYAKLATGNFATENTYDLTRKVIRRITSVMEIEKISEDEALLKAVEQLQGEKAHVLKGSMFTPRNKKSRLTENMDPLFEEEAPEEVPTPSVKTVSGKNINVSAIIREASKEQNEQLGQDSLVSDFKKALKKASEGNTNNDPKE